MGMLDYMFDIFDGDDERLLDDIRSDDTRDVMRDNTESINQTLRDNQLRNEINNSYPWRQI